MTVHVRPSLLADREYISSLATRFSEFDLPDWRSADDLHRTNRLSLQKALGEPEPGAAILVADDDRNSRLAHLKKDARLTRMLWMVLAVRLCELAAAIRRGT